MANEAIDRYHIIEKIGAGGMGTVYRALDREIEREVALKWLPAFFSDDNTFTERFKREARVIARLEHPHIVPIYDVGENEGRPFIIMRLLTGGTLRERAARPDFDLNALVKAVEEIADALSSAHARNIVHRDIKPGNILFDDNGSAFLSDFGIAKILDSGTQLTGSGFIGTPAYMSPEQFIGQAIDGRSDQYALAIVVFETLTGSLPFKGNTAQMMYKHINAKPPDIDLAKHPVPAGLNPVLQKALAKEPENRYARIADFAAALKNATREDPLAAAMALPFVAGTMVPTPEKPPTAPTNVDPLTEQKTEQVRQDYRAGLEAMSRGDWALALTAFNSVLKTAPSYGNALEFKQQAEANLSMAAPVAPAPVVEPPIEPTADLEEDNLDIASLAVPLAAMKILGSKEDSPNLEKTSLDLPPAAGLSAAEETVIHQIEKTSLDLPPLVAPPTAAGLSRQTTPATDATTLDMPPVAAAPSQVQTSLDLPPVMPLPADAVAEPAPMRQKERSGIPIWLAILAAVLLLLICAGGGYAAFNYFKGPEETASLPTAVAPTAVSGVVISDDKTAVPTDQEALEPTETPLPPATNTLEPVVVAVEDTAEPSTPTEAPSNTPEPLSPTVRVTFQSVALRRGPGTRYQTDGYLLEGETAEILAKNNDGSWYNVLLADGRRGWLSADVVELVESIPVSSIPVAATIPVAPTATFTPLPPPTLPPLPPPPTAPPEGGGNGGGSGGGSGGGGGNGGSKPPPQYTAERP